MQAQHDETSAQRSARLTPDRNSGASMVNVRVEGAMIDQHDPPPRPWEVGAAIEVFSRGERAWLPGIVMRVRDEGTHELRYGKGSLMSKSLALDELATFVRAPQMVAQVGADSDDASDFHCESSSDDGAADFNCESSSSDPDAD